MVASHNFLNNNPYYNKIPCRIFLITIYLNSNNNNPNNNSNLRYSLKAIKMEILKILYLNFQIPKSKKK